MGDAERRRRRLRHQGESDAPEGAGHTASTAPVYDEGTRPKPGARRAELDPSDDGSRSPRGARRAELESSEPRGRRSGPSGEDGDRGLRGLVGSGSSQVSVTAALRARDAARPTEDDLAEAEARVVIVRRNWVPREELPRNGR
ncbi:hypothetical protein [Micromonospora sp. NPDC050495]|uniref:hypothetical protein n=1 Tax=Micromonospora sp. NPDC050495 TaxID=3154936 RepID=UPI0033D0BBC5